MPRVVEPERRRQLRRLENRLEVPLGHVAGLEGFSEAPREHEAVIPVEVLLP
jgi:hypothetical protein